MKILIKRFRSHKEKGGFTLGKMYIDGEFMCYTCEDEFRKVKVNDETRIPCGIFEVKFKPSSRFDADYIKRFGKSFHKGMLWIINVPGFEGILIHIGNSEKDTSGCLLVGLDMIETEGKVGRSADAYKKIYPIISGALINNKKVTIEIVDDVADEELKK